MIGLEQLAIAARIERELRETRRHPTGHHRAARKRARARPARVVAGRQTRGRLAIAAVLRGAGAALDRLAGMLDGAAVPVERVA